MKFSAARNTLILLAAVLLFGIVYGTRQHRSLFEGCNRSGDYALILFNVEEASDLRALTGPYSRFGFRHPGPILFYYYAFFDSVTGHTGTEQARYSLAQLVLNLCFLTVTALALYAVFQSLTIPLAGVSLLAIGAHIGREGLWHDIWGPSTLLPSVAAFLTACLALSRGHLAFVFPAVVSGTAALSNHLGSAPLVFVISATTGWYVMRGRFRPKSNVEIAFIILAFVLLAAAWLPPILDAVAGNEWGNAGRIVDFALSSDSSHQNPWIVVRYVSSFLLFPILRIMELGTPLRIVGVLSLLAAPWVFRGAVPHSVRVILLAAVFALFAAAFRIEGKLYGYLLLYGYAVGTVAWLLVGEILLRRATPRVGLLVSVCLSIAFVLSPLLTRSRGGTCRSKYERAVSALPREPLALYTKRAEDWSSLAGIAAVLRRDKREFCVDTRWHFMFPERFLCADNSAPRTQIIISKKQRDPDAPLIVEDLAMRIARN